MNKNEIIKLCEESHNINYDYSLVTDSKLSDKISVICPKHGIFTPRLNRFLHGSNCPKCVNKIISTKEEFIEKANKIHNNKYNYDKFIYINAHTKGIITCPEHGDFLQSPTNHLNGNGCKKCANFKIKEKLTSTKEAFIEKANKIHNNKYNYDKFEYVNVYTKGIITCPEHGDFYQTPMNHLQGKGCFICNKSHLENDLILFFNENNIKYEYQKKFNWLGKQSIDFFLTDFNLAIECQGKQHFGDGGWGKDDNNINIINNDIKKYDLCNNHNINIIYYTNYFVKDKIYDFYQDKTILYSINEIMNFLGINKIKNDIISLLNDNDIKFIDDKNRIIIDNLYIYPIDNLTNYYNDNNKNFFSDISIKHDLNNERAIWIKPFEWYNESKRNILSSFILSACGVIKNRIYARDCYIKEITNKEIKSFLERTSMYGFRSSSLILGLFLKKDINSLKKDTLVMCYTFGKAFYGKGKYDIEIIRASTELFTQVIGGASKLWSYFIKNFNEIKIGNKLIKWNTCCYYVDFDHNNGNSLKYLGFKFSHYSKGGFHNVYYGGIKKINRMPSKHKEIQDMINKHEIFTIYNAGTKVFIYNKESS